MKEQKPGGPAFEQKLESLEQMVQKMEEGGLQLEAMLKLYEEGMNLSRSLSQDLEQAQQKLQKLRAGSLQEMNEADGL